MRLVSIVLPYFNPQLDYLRQSVDSIVGQTYDNWELLLVDDGSEADATACAKQLVDSDPRRIKYFDHENHQNLGASAARNLGLRHARGDYVAFQDSDDVWMPDKLQRQVALLEANSQAMATFGNTLYWHSWTGQTEDADRDECPWLGIDRLTSIAPPLYLQRTLQSRAAVPCITSIVLRRKILESIGGFEDSFPGLYDDQVFCAKIWINCAILVMPDWLEKYRQHPNSMCAKASGSQTEKDWRTAYLNWLRDYIREQGLEGTPLWRQLAIESRIDAMGKTGVAVRRIRRLYRRMTASGAI